MEIVPFVSVLFYSFVYSLWSVTSGLPGPISACLRRGPRGCFRNECCIAGESTTAPRLDRFLAPSSPSTSLDMLQVPF